MFLTSLSVNGDSQGVERLFGALSAHIWPGMILKSGDKIVEPSLPEREELSESESDYELEYEVLSAGLAKPWDDSDEVWVSAVGSSGVPSTRELVAQNSSVTVCNQENWTIFDNPELQPSMSRDVLGDVIDNKVVQNVEEPSNASDMEMGKHFNIDDLEQLMSEIGNMRSNLRLMLDFQRREMAAKMAMKMAGMFGGSDDEEGFDSSKAI